MQLYLSVTPDEAVHRSFPNTTLVHIAYRIGPNNTLLRQNLLLQTKYGLLAVSDRDACPIDQPQALCSAVLRECNRRNFSGVLLDFEQSPRQDLLLFARQLSLGLSNSRRILFVPEHYANCAPQAIPLICTALSGGDLNTRLQEAKAAYPGRKLALDLQRLRMDFSLPARSGEGQFLTDRELQALMAQKEPPVFFSSSLCVRYFTYAQNDIAHFVLFDDAETLRQKIRIGNQLGFCAAFFQWPEVSDIAEKLFPQT